MMMKFSEDTKKYLKKYGWSESRKIDTLKYEKKYQEEGYLIFDKALEVLSNFGDLRFSIPEKPIGTTTLHFDVIKTVEDNFKENVEFYESKIGEALLPIGEAYRDYFMIMLSESGNYNGYYAVIMYDITTGVAAVVTKVEIGDVLFYYPTTGIEIIMCKIN